jgi:hypothetical protein
MNTNKAAYWIVLGVLALGLNSEYQHGRFVTLHRAANRADSVLCRISVRAEQTLAVARLLMDRDGSPVDNLLASADSAEMARNQAAMLRDQAQDEAELLRDTVRDQVRDQLRAQADVIRARAEMQRAEIEQIRWRTASQFSLARSANRGVGVICPKTGARITLNRPNSADAPIEIEDQD